MMASCCNRAFDVDTDSFPRLYFFFFNDTATTEIYTLSLHDALPIFASRVGEVFIPRAVGQGELAVQLPLVPRVEAVAPRPRMIDVRNLKDSAPVRRRSHQERRSDEHTSELQSQSNLACRILLDRKITTRCPYGC